MKTILPTSCNPLSVRLARAIRHAPVLRTMEPVWGRLRGPFHRVLRWLSRDRGLPLEIQGVGTLRVPPSFLTGEVDALEIPMLQRMVGMISPEGCFYDIGASIGLHSLVASHRLNAAGEIHAFEPDLPSCGRYWDHTQIVRRRLKVRLSRTFISDRSTAPNPLELFPAELTQTPAAVEHQPTRHLYLFEPGHDETSGGSIPCISLDAYVAAGARVPTTIKCDIEGAELLFLRGATATLRASRPTLFVSIHPDLVEKFGYGVDDVFDFLRAHGYTWEVLDSTGEMHVFATSGTPA